MRSADRATGPGIPRLFALCAVLLGLFLMHGSPTAAGGGCHSEMGTATAAASMDDGRASAMAGTEAVPAQPRGDALRARAMNGTAAHGAVCVAAPAQGQITLPLAPLVCVLALAALAAWGVHRARGSDGTRRRGPPGGRELLLRVCIART
ncbi:hypothetical protein J2Z21_004281 [Streptomyces griseochromogenes]|uniref:Uncharacterized protein n=1 Tax=Streptomyces griseochromogenes TaxID=68214 RepID=A0A1B1AVH5_9ACTN|nr:hypothetical protein [Streptomyces griseochromogenes]ANP50545.1 hypothetical protein AVL59_13755 [Streptomyces griseochromogenes]MBP2051310.1 hypothetical protein [Streptomyces griseochromogenes]